MLIIRLRRGGKKHEPHYRIVVQEQRSKLGGKYIESLGHYHPTITSKPITINKERVLYWLKNGAKPSVTATNLFVKNDILPKEQKIAKVYSKKTKTKKEGVETKIEKTIKSEKTDKQVAGAEDTPIEPAHKEEASQVAENEEVKDLKIEEIKAGKEESQ